MRLGEKLDAQIIVGTPKEIVSFSIMRQFNIEDIEYIIVDDVDLVNTSDLFRFHVMEKLASSSVKMFIASQLRTSTTYSSRMEVISEPGNRNITETYLKCASITQKIRAIVSAYTVLKKYNAQGIVYFRVNIIIYFNQFEIIDSMISI